MLTNHRGIIAEHYADLQGIPLLRAATEASDSSLGLGGKQPARRFSGGGDCPVEPQGSCFPGNEGYRSRGHRMRQPK